jgi:hypothetical protein
MIKKRRIVLDITFESEGNDNIDKIDYEHFDDYFAGQIEGALENAYIEHISVYKEKGETQ